VQPAERTVTRPATGLLFRISLAAAASVLSAALTTATADAAWTSCTFDSSSGAVVATTDTASGSFLTVGASGEILADSTQCDGATVFNTDTVLIGATGDSAAVGIDLSGGPFAPGATPEGIGTPEIEFTFSLPGDSLPAVIGGPGPDTIMLGALGANLNGDDDVDVTVVGTPTFTLAGGNGDDALSSSGDAVTGGSYPAVAILSGGPGADTLTGGTSSEILTGGPDDDELSGGEGDDALHGQGGFDLLDGGAGDDHLDGGGDGDRAVYTPAPGPVTATLPGGTAAGGDGFGTTDSYVSIEHLSGSGYGDVLTGDGGANVIFAGGGNDTIRGRGGNDAIRGWTGDDEIQGGPGDDGLSGDDGDDQIKGGAGDDELQDGSGDDFLYGEGGGDFIEASEWDPDLGLQPIGADLLSGGGGTDTVAYWFRASGVLVTLDGLANDGPTGLDNVGPADDVENLEGSLTGADALIGNAKANSISGFGGGDKLEGGGGKDTLDGGSGGDALVGGAGKDTLLADDGEFDNVDGGPANDTADIDPLDVVTAVELIF
jgi:Ca2+-binding RTX toxin-like protein